MYNVVGKIYGAQVKGRLLFINISFHNQRLFAHFTRLQGSPAPAVIQMAIA